MNLQLFEYAVADGATNMARDEAMMSCVSPGLAALRFYGWSPWCLSLGRNQPVSELLGGRPRSELAIGTDVVRRPTGGRSVYHGPEVTYAFACSDRTAGGPKSVNETLHRGLEVGLTNLGVQFDTNAPSILTELALDERACFRDPAPGELTVDGRKLVGSAQWRHGRALLQHGSILLDNRQGAADLALKFGRDHAVKSAIGLSDVLDPTPAIPDLIRSLSRAVEEAFGARSSTSVSIDELETSCADTYRSEAWTWPRQPAQAT